MPLVTATATDRGLACARHCAQATSAASHLHPHLMAELSPRVTPLKGTRRSQTAPALSADTELLATIFNEL